MQYLVAAGIIVVAPNVRGSTGYGRAFHEADDKAHRWKSVADLHAVRADVGQWSEVDAMLIGIFGRSYGGYMTLAALTEHPEQWCVGVDFYGITNFHTLLQTTGPWRRYLRAAEYGDPVQDAELLKQISPVHRLHRVQAPLLLVHGMDDPRVPPGESEMVASILRGLGKPYSYLRIDHEGHGFAQRDNRKRVFSAFAAFLHRTL